MENIETVVRLADKYDVLKYVNVSTLFLKGQLTLDKMCWGYQLAVNLKNKDLIEFCEDKIEKRPKEVFATDAFKRCDKGILQRILELDLVCKEVDVFDACVTWAKYACEQDDLNAMQVENLRTQLGDCLQLIRFGLMKIEEFSKCYVLHKGLFTSEEFEDVMLSFTMKEYKPKMFNPRSRIHNVTWDNRNVMECLRKTNCPKPKKYIKLQEVTSFSANNHLMLGEIQTACTYIGSSEIVGSEVGVTITECEGLTCQSTVLPTVLYKGTSKVWFGYDMDRLKVTLPQPIRIKPQFMYEVRLVVRSPNGCYYYSDCRPIVEMKNGTNIQFHRHPNLGYDNLANGWISHLLFNKI
ncbi:BTB/POZ domain-containing protein 1-like [Sitodiplosis mosellana]|uniref:BTB/POZ domain-containing protein 1-like n=1 Tax=Sitodiplosis mosellana TaxID=263140 RepID=UPI0024441AAF|nr:BTB/POZ domain-containing protein 1-like [Sitodiplosis mosellana]